MTDETFVAGDLIRKARTQAGISQSDLADRAGVTQVAISMYETHRRQPSLPVLIGLLRLAGTDLVLSTSTKQLA